ncbi:YcnI family protein [Ammonicoccus fulvus]|uniref:YcnI family protein n=1 Tax=Ammonicoccus fulvus TaxID=3138240 RepID=A0ABZ3FIY1_9ACTN
MRSTHPRPVAFAAAAVGATALAVASALPAHAHVGASASGTAAGSYTVVTLSVPHGCSGSPTTKLAIKIPDGINAVTPTRTANWTVTKTMAKLPAPITDAHGNTISERVSEVVYTATTPLPDGYRDAFQLSMQLPAGAAGTTLYFPAIQTCEQGQADWVEIPAAGQAEHDLQHPAPSIGVTAAVSGSDEDHAAPTGHPTEAVAHSETATDSRGLSIAALVLGALGLLAGGLALFRGRRPVA